MLLFLNMIPLSMFNKFLQQLFNEKNVPTLFCLFAINKYLR